MQEALALNRGRRQFLKEEKMVSPGANPCDLPFRFCHADFSCSAKAAEKLHNVALCAFQALEGVR